MTLRILHISDTHGMLPVPESLEYDVVVHSGDMMPNRTFGVKPVEHTFQKHWIEENAPRFHARYWAKPFLYVPGNHDYYDPTPVMRELGIDARLLCNAFMEVNGVGFYGSPWTPTFYDWNWMCGPKEMREHLAPLASLMERGAVDVLVTHGPMYGVLDRNQQGERCGCKVLRSVVREAAYAPKLHLHGHIHEQGGSVVPWSRGMVVSNAARTQQVVTV